MREEDIGSTRPFAAEPVIDTAHRIRRRMRVIREVQTEVIHTGDRPSHKGPRFLLFLRSPLSLRARERVTRDSATIWFVLGAWLLFFTVIGAVLLLAMHLKGRV